MRLVRGLLALGTVALMSCTDATSPTDAVAGLYALQFVNARALPTVTICGGFTVVAADLALGTGGQATYTRRLISGGPGAESLYLIVAGTYRVTEREVLVEGEGRWSRAPNTYRAELRFERVSGQLRSTGDGPACDAPAEIEEFVKVVDL